MAKKSSDGKAETANPAAAPVVLFGWGEWSRKNWFPVLAQLAKWGVIDLTVVERWSRSDSPIELSDLEKEGVLRYLSWEDCFKSAVATRWQVAYVVTSAAAHHGVIHTLLRQSSDLKVIVCEKPCGESINQALEITDACHRCGVTLLIADHYLLRPSIQHLLAHPELMRSIGRPMQIIAAINESKGTGPQQGVIADLLTHLLNLLLILFPGAHFTPNTAYTAQAINSASAGYETYTLAVGNLNLSDGSVVPCEIEGGKHLVTDKKSIIVSGTHGKLSIDLLNNSLTLTIRHKETKEISKSWKPQWSYARLILKSLSLSSQNSGPSSPM